MKCSGDKWCLCINTSKGTLFRAYVKYMYLVRRIRLYLCRSHEEVAHQLHSLLLAEYLHIRVPNRQRAVAYTYLGT